MASSTWQLTLQMSGLPASMIASITNQAFQNANAVPDFRALSLTTSESSYVITSTNYRIFMAGQVGNATVYYHSFLTGFTAADGVPNHATEPTILTIPTGGDTIYFRLPAGTATIFVAQF